MSEESIPNLPYAQRHHAGVDPSQIYRVMAITGLVAAVGRLVIPLRLLGGGFGSIIYVSSFSLPGLSTLLSILIALLYVTSLAALLAASIGMLTARRSWSRWLWLSEPAVALASAINYAASYASMMSRTSMLPTGFYSTFALGFLSSLAVPLLLLLLLRIVSAVEREDALR